MQIDIDYREQKLQSLLQPSPHVQSLLLGDIRLYDEKYEVLLERKTWNDLRASLRDGRFREQRSRLLLWKNEASDRQIGYIVEGMYEKEFQIERQTLYRLMIGYSIPIFFTNGLCDTANLLTFFHRSCSLQNLFKTRSIEHDQIESRLKGAKKKNFTDPKLFFLQMLLSIRGVSSPMATAVGQHFNSLNDFVHLYHHDKSKWEYILQNITYTTNQQNQKKLPRHILEKFLNNIGLNKNEVFSTI